MSGSAQEEPPISDWGKDLYMRICAFCHEESGKGDGSAAVALKHPPADMTQLSKKHSGTFPRATVASVSFEITEA